MRFPTRCQRPSPAGRRPTRVARLQLTALDDRSLPSAVVLDPAFGGGTGYVATAVSTGNAEARAVLVQPSGTILAAGNTVVPGTSQTCFGVVAYNPDGTVDAAFGSGGIVQQLFAGQWTSSASLVDAVLEPMDGSGDAKILLAGRDGTNRGPALMRLNPDGSLDTAFGDGGQVITPFGSAGGGYTAVAVTGDGHILTAGNATVAPLNSWLLARYNADGSLDPTFGTGGKVTTVFSSTEQGFGAFTGGLALQPDGKIVVSGNQSWYVAGAPAPHGVVVRYNMDGSLDTSFGTAGIVHTVIGSESRTSNRDIAVYAGTGTPNDGKIVVAGSVYTSPPGAVGSETTYEWAVARYNADGSPDPTFGGGTGSVVIPDTQPGLSSCVAAQIDPAGRLALAGNSDTGTTFAQRVARLTTDGTLDPAFGDGGMVTTAINYSDSTFGLAIQPADGVILTAGYSYLQGGKNLVTVARYLGDRDGGIARISDVRVTEGNGGTTLANFTVTLAAPSADPVIISYATSGGTAAAGTDYQPTSGTLTFAPGETTQTIAVPVNGDRLAEATETFAVNLYDSSGARITLGVGTIADDEPHLSIGDVTKLVGKKGTKTVFTFTVTLSAAYDQPVTVKFRTVDDSSKAGTDYVAQTGTITFNPGETQKTISVTVLGGTSRTSKVFYLDLFDSSVNSLIDKGRGVGTVLYG